MPLMPYVILASRGLRQSWSLHYVCGMVTTLGEDLSRNLAWNHAVLYWIIKPGKGNDKPVVHNKIYNYTIKKQAVESIKNPCIS